MAARAEELRCHEQEAVKRATDTTDSEAKRIWLTVAKNWHDMADQAERNDW
jgi:hypothetical protein